MQAFVVRRRALSASTIVGIKWQWILQVPDTAARLPVVRVLTKGGFGKKGGFDAHALREWIWGTPERIQVRGDRLRRSPPAIVRGGLLHTSKSVSSMPL
jgi:hypothetical protein